MSNLVKRGNTWFARLHIPEARWADVGRAMGVPSGIRREIVRTLRTTKRTEAAQRRDEALAAMRAEVDGALRRAGLNPLTDWTADWLIRAVERRGQMTAGRDEVVFQETRPDEPYPAPWTVADILHDDVEREAEEVEARQGSAAAARFRQVAFGEGLTIAEAARRWLAEIHGTVRHQTHKGHMVALGRLGEYLAARGKPPSLEGIALADISRREAGEFIAYRRQQVSDAAVQREFSAYSGLWRWALRRGYVNINPWADQLAGMKNARADDDTDKRAFLPDELVSLLRAGQADLAPQRGALAPVLWDVIRLLLLTGARPRELLSLRMADVLLDGAAVALASRGGKTTSAQRVIPLHPLATSVLRSRIETLPDLSPEAPLWPEVPAQGADANRAKTISTRFIPVRRRLLGNDDADLYSFRRSFITACETSMHRGGRINPQMIALFVGHRRNALAFDVYSDWSRLDTGALAASLHERLGPLWQALDDVVFLGFDSGVTTALRETAGNRPPVVRLSPLFKRR